MTETQAEAKPASAKASIALFFWSVFTSAASVAFWAGFAAGVLALQALIAVPSP